MINKRDDFKTFIVIIAVCAICVIIAFILNIKSNTDKLEAVNEYNVFFTNVNYVNNYINCISLGDNKCVYDLLDYDYINKNNITYENVFDYVHNYSSGSSIRVTSMDFVQIGDNFLYFINGSIYRNDYDGVELIDDDFSIIIMSDYDSLSYSLYPVNDNYKSVINSIKKISIESNNSISKSELISKEQVCVIYLSDFFNFLVNDIYKSYSLVSDDMKKIYGTFDEYKSYVGDNINLFSSVVDKCKLEEVNTRKVYTVIDDKGNSYVFTEESIMNYSVDFYLVNVNQ